MKHKIFILSLFALVTVGSFVMADYVDPTSSAPSGNTGSVVKTGPDTSVRTFEKIGTGGTCDSYGCNGLANFFYSGLYSDKLVTMGVSQIDGNFEVFNRLGTVFDGYVYPAQNLKDPNTQASFNSKPIEAVISGNLASRLIISNKETSQPAYALQLEPATNPTFNPTTNIGLGDSCNLYPANLDSGCLSDAYVSMFKNPSFSGTLSSSNNTNSQVVGTCTSFKPSTSPTSTGNCFTQEYTNFVFFEKTVNTNPCVSKITVNAAYPYGRAKNPKIGVAHVSGPTTPDRTVAPTAGTTLQYSTSVNPSTCDNRADFFGDGGVWKFYVTDDYGQYYEHQI